LDDYVVEIKKEKEIKKIVEKEIMVSQLVKKNSIQIMTLMIF
jgi:hypothetical protein